jgi:signal transduction histidine kinase
VLLDKHQVLQILLNLINNAKHAMPGEPGQGQGQGHQITLRITKSGNAAVQLQVTDNGEGIAPENLIRIFSHGFTTRQDGHGFGLHSCALATKGMGGILTAHSEGAGSGATFTLRLPIRAAVPAEAL